MVCRLYTSSSSQREVTVRFQSAGMAAQQAKGLKFIWRVHRFWAAVATVSASGQAGPSVTMGRPTDWPHLRLVLSDPGAGSNGRGLLAAGTEGEGNDEQK